MNLLQSHFGAITSTYNNANPPATKNINPKHICKDPNGPLIFVVAAALLVDGEEVDWLAAADDPLAAKIRDKLSEAR